VIEVEKPAEARAKGDLAVRPVVIRRAEPMTEKRCVRVPGLVVGLALLAGWGSAAVLRAAPTRKDPKPAGANSVEGLVVNEAGAGLLSGRAGIKGHDPVGLEPAGRFSFSKVPEVYDVWVANQRADSVVVYQGLCRRDPVIPFPQGYEPPRESAHRATIQGILRGEFPFPAEHGYMATVSYGSDRAMAVSQLAQGMPSGGPRFGPWNMQWEGEPKLDGTLVALGQHSEKDQPWLEAFLASKPLSLTPGTTASVELKLAPVSIGHIAGEVDILHKDIVRNIHFFYRLATRQGKNWPRQLSRAQDVRLRASGRDLARGHLLRGRFYLRPPHHLGHRHEMRGQAGDDRLLDSRRAGAEAQGPGGGRQRLPGQTLLLR